MDSNNSEYDSLPPRSESFGSIHNQSHKKRRITCFILLVLVLVAFYSAGGYALNLLGDTRETLDKTFSKTNIKKSRNVSSVLKDGRSFSVLLLGTDTGDLGRSDKGRTDTMIVATVNRDKHTVTMTSIPRDLAVKVPDSINPFDKINAAYTIGGVSTAIKTVQNTIDVPIDYYILVNMGGLRKIVDAIGGVTIKPLLTFKYEDADVTKDKTVHLNGKQALAYSRMRYDDPDGDYGRQKRQKQIITAIINKAVSISSISRYDAILKSIESNMKTDLTYDDMITIESKYKSAANHVKSYTLQGSESYLDGVSSYQVATAAEKKKISDKIRHQLGYEDSDHNFENDDFNDSANNYQNNNSYDNNYNNGYGGY